MACSTLTCVVPLYFLPVGPKHALNAAGSSTNLHNRPVSAAASRSSSPGDDSDSGFSSPRSVDENPASTSQAAESSSGTDADASSSAGSTGQPADSPFLALPLLIASSLSHVNRQYIKMRRRRKWWSKMGGYPKVIAFVTKCRNINTVQKLQVAFTGSSLGCCNMAEGLCAPSRWHRR